MSLITRLRTRLSHSRPPVRAVSADEQTSCAAVQSGRSLSESETARIVAFRETLTGDIPSNYSNPHERGE